MEGLNFLLRCNYNVKYFDQLPVFYNTILESFSELKTLHGYDQLQDLVLFNNKDILVGGRPVYIHEWFKREVVFVNDLLNENGKFLIRMSDKFSSLLPSNKRHSNSFIDKGKRQCHSQQAAFYKR